MKKNLAEKEVPLNKDSIVSDALEEKLAEQEILRQSLEEKKKQAEEYYDQLLRLKAEFENYRRRVEKEKEKIYLRGKETILIKLITILDTLEQAERNIISTSKIEDVREGLKLIHTDFVSFLKDEGVEPIETIGKKFDPQFHEVIEHEETDKEEGLILEELQKGYIFNGLVIRPTKVKIAKKTQ